jgi:hypothetical protein
LYRAAPVILPSNFANYEGFMANPDGSTDGINEFISASPATGSNVVSSAVAINSGKGYVDGEQIHAYLYSGVSNNIIIAAGGVGYSNGDSAIFSGGGSGTAATGYVSTNTVGGITSLTLTNQGSGYTEIPRVSIKSANGIGASITVTLTEYNTTSEITARVVKTGIGKSRGFWTTTRSFLNSDKYIQDSYYYQDYSYEIKVAENLDKYKNIIYNTFHSAGSELFGKYLKINIANSPTELLYEQVDAIFDSKVYLNSDNTFIKSDDTYDTVDKLVKNIPFTADLIAFYADSTTKTADQTAA